MAHRVAGQLEPAATAVRMHPALAGRTPRVVAEEQEPCPLLVGQRGRVGRVRHARLAAVRELRLVPAAAPRARDQDQCATPAAPCSSISAPVVNRSSEKGAFSSCGSSCASVHANAQPEPGVALKPPVPQPQFTYSPSTGVGPTIGDASGHTSTIPAQVRRTLACAKIGKDRKSTRLNSSHGYISYAV